MTTRERHIVLIGMMGSGKTTVGGRLARILDRPFVDSDVQVEQRAARTVREIFETDGEAAYRVLESEVLAEALASEEPAVIAAAGGTILDANNRHRLLEVLPFGVQRAVVVTQSAIGWDVDPGVEHLVVTIDQGEETKDLSTV